jgi:enoyl-CoA hydratase
MSIQLSVEGPVATLVLDRQAKLNALDLACFDALHDFTARIRENRAVRAVLLLAEGARAFSAGADIRDLDNIDAEEASRRATFRREVFQQFSELPIPTIAVVEAPAMGGGVEMALACTFRIASPSATFSFPEIKLGLLPGAGGTQRLPRLVGEAYAIKMMLTARSVDAAEAHGVGLVDEVANDARQAARVLAASWLHFSRDAMAGIIAAIRDAQLPLREGLHAEGRHLAQLSSGEDGLEGVRAFLERRPARFNRGL